MASISHSYIADRVVLVVGVVASFSLHNDGSFGVFGVNCRRWASISPFTDVHICGSRSEYLVSCVLTTGTLDKRTFSFVGPSVMTWTRKNEADVDRHIC